MARPPQTHFNSLTIEPIKTWVVVLIANRVTISNHSFSWRVLKSLTETRKDMRWNEKTQSVEMEIFIDVNKY